MSEAWFETLGEILKSKMSLLGAFSLVVVALLAVMHPLLIVGATFNDEAKKAFVITHNRLRETAVPTAAAMRFITWNANLERLAVAAANTCVYEHSYGGEYATLGENIYYTTWGRPDPVHVTLAWFSEKSDYDHVNKKCTGGVCGHYVEVMAEAVTEIGCGMKACEIGNLVFCEYNYNAGGSIFQYGPQCSECPAEMPLCLNGLCISAAVLAQPATKLVDSTVTTASATCRLACKTCGKLDTGAGNCKCNCGAEATGYVCQAKNPGSTANCPACPGNPPCLNGGEVDMAITQKCSCKCKAGFVGDRCEAANGDYDSSVKLVIAAASEFKIITFTVMPPVARSLFNSKIWSVLQPELARAVNDFCRADATSFAKCCPGKSFPSSIPTAATHVTAADFKFIDSQVKNTLDGSLNVPVYAMAASSGVCATVSGPAVPVANVPSSVLTSAITPKITAISDILKVCCDDVLLKAVAATLSDPSGSAAKCSTIERRTAFAIAASVLLLW